VTINATAETYAFYYIAAAEYHVDDPNPIPGTGTPMYAVDGTFDEAIEDISGVLDTWNLSVGSHAICVLAEESAANGTWWSACGTVTLIISGAPVSLVNRMSSDGCQMEASNPMGKFPCS